jgi:DNA (cytosine-5)-methyltransferase 1
MSEAKNSYTIGGLCSGIGGIELGFRHAGFDISWANDMDEKAMVTYKRMIGENHYINEKAMSIMNAVNEHKDVFTENPVSVIAAGFPCQAFSIAGERRGFDDARGTVIHDIFEVINLYDDESKPDVIFLENVKNFKTHDDGNTYGTIEKKLYKMGYSVYTKIMNTYKYTDIPQNRERTFMVCYKGEEDWIKYKLHDGQKIPKIEELENEMKFAKEKENESDYKSILNEAKDKFNFDDLESLNDKNKLKLYNYTNIHYKAKKDAPKTYMFHKNFPRPTDKLKDKSKFVSSTSQGPKYSYKKTINGVKKEKEYVTLLNKEYEELKRKNDGSEDTFYQIRRVYARGNKSKLCPTFTANMGTGGHNVPLVPKVSNNGRITWRKLTPKECLLLQGFPEFKRPNISTLSNGQLYKQAGNSVSVPVIEKLATAIYKTLNN